MREFSVPAVVTVGSGENLVAPVYDNAAKSPDTVVFRRRGADRAWSDVTAAAFAAEVTDVARGLSLGADGYVTKPFKISGLVSAVNSVLGLEG